MVVNSIIFILISDKIDCRGSGLKVCFRFNGCFTCSQIRGWAVLPFMPSFLVVGCFPRGPRLGPLPFSRLFRSALPWGRASLGRSLGRSLWDVLGSGMAPYSAEASVFRCLRSEPAFFSNPPPPRLNFLKGGHGGRR